MATTYLTRTSGTPTNALKWTFSAWVKIASIPNDTFLLDFYTDGNNRSQIGFSFSTKTFILNELVSGATSQLFLSNRKFRDNSGWYNIVVSCDRTLATAGDRTKIYVNGVQETSWSTQTNPTQNVTGIINTAVGTLIGKYSDGALYFNGSMSHVHFVDGTAYPASTFGSTDSTTGEWEINTSPTVTYGNNGFFILKNDNVINDQSGNANNFTLGGGTLTKTEDCPDNVFATINPLYYSSAQSTLSNGNLTATSSGASWNNFHSTIAPSTGKWYWEVKVVNVGSNTHPIGIVGTEASDINSTSPGDSFDNDTTGISYVQTGDKDVAGSRTSYGNSYTTGDIIGVAMDLTNSKLYFSKNGTFQNSGVPTSGSTGTGAISIVSGHSYLASFAHYNTMVDSVNFGNGFFGTTAVSSAGTNASGNGIFEYDVPTGYTALSTKGLNE